ncbi:MAG TPA: hypothetical protein PK445_07180 [Methanolinea sp.]|nr:hypothetical protein [Methanolinea sp.]HQJ88872.1 hypothetical protein [Methanoregulaceae archaeon]
MIAACVGQGAALRRPDTYTKSLLRGDGNGQTIHDLAGKTWTNNGNVSLTQTNRRFIGNVIYLDGTDDHLTTPAGSSGDFIIDANVNFTIEFWLYVTRQSVTQVVIENWGINRPWSFTYHADNTLLVQLWNNTNGNLMAYHISPVLSSNWHHIALSRTGGSTIKSFLDGVAFGTSSSALAVWRYSDHIIDIGAHNGGNMAGYIQGFRFTKGVGRYSADFVPPTRRY